MEELSLHPDDRTIKPLDTMDTMCVLAPLGGRRRVCACGFLGSASLNSRGPHEHLVVT